MLRTFFPYVLLVVGAATLLVGLSRPRPPDVVLESSERIAFGDDELRCKKFFPEVGMTLSVPCEGPEVDPEGIGRKLDRALAVLDMGKVAFEPEQNMYVDEPKEVEAVLGIDVPSSKLKSLVRQNVGQSVEIAQLEVADVMAAELSGYAFDIVPRGRQEQPISRKGPTRWTWLVTPRNAGLGKLRLTFYASILINGKERQRRLEPVLEKPIQVNVTWPHWVDAKLDYVGKITDLKEFWMILVGVVSSIWGGLILIRQKIKAHRGSGETAN